MSLHIVVNPFMIGSHQISFAVVCTLLSELFPLECRPCQACQGDIGADIRRKCAAARKCEDIERGTMGVNNTGNPQLEPSLPASAPSPHDYPTISDSRAAPFSLLDLCISKRAFHQAFHDSKHVSDVSVRNLRAIQKNPQQSKPFYKNLSKFAIIKLISKRANLA